MSRRTLAVLGFVLVAVAAQAGLVWQEDMSDVSDWNLVIPDTIGSSKTSDGTNGYFGVTSGSAWGWWAPNTHATIDTARLGSYDFSFQVPTISGSMSYVLAADVFDSSGAYLRSLSSNFVNQTTFTGSNTVNFATAFGGVGAGEWANVAQIAPKLGLSTGDGSQQMQINDLQILDAVPEPSTLALLGVAGALAFAMRRRKTT